MPSSVDLCTSYRYIVVTVCSIASRARWFLSCGDTLELNIKKQFYQYGMSLQSYVYSCFSRGKAYSYRAFIETESIIIVIVTVIVTVIVPSFFFFFFLQAERPAAPCTTPVDSIQALLPDWASPVFCTMAVPQRERLLTFHRRAMTEIPYA